MSGIPLLLPVTLSGLVRLCVIFFYSYPFLVGRVSINQQPTRMGRSGLVALTTSVLEEASSNLKRGSDPTRAGVGNAVK